jgi:hypothetical protein
VWSGGKAYATDVPLPTGPASRWRIRDGLLAVGHDTRTTGYVTPVSTYTGAGAAHEVVGLTTIALDVALDDLELADGALYVIGRRSGDVVVRVFGDLAADVPAGADLYTETDTNPGLRWLLAINEGRFYRMRPGGINDTELFVHDLATGALLDTITLPLVVGASPGNIFQVRGDLLTLMTGSSARTLRLFSLAMLSSSAESLSAIVTDLCARVGVFVDASELLDSVPGYVRSRPMSVRAALEPLQQAYAFDAVEVGGVVKFRKRGGAPLGGVLTRAECLAERGATMVRSVDVELPQRITVTYSALSRDYLPGSQQSQRYALGSDSELLVELPIALADDKAAQVAELLRLDAWHSRERVELATSLDWLALEPGDVVGVEGSGGEYLVRVTETGYEYPLTLRVGGILESVLGWSSAAVGADLSTPPQAVAAAGRTELYVASAPLLRDADLEGGFYVFAHGWAAGWRGCEVWRSLDGSLWSALGTITRAATVGSVLEVPSASARPEHVEGGGSILVRLHSGALSGVADAAFYLGARVALVGLEVIAFRDVVQETATDWRVSYLARGCRGSEAAIASHVVGERFLLLEPSAWLRVEAPALGATAYFRGVSGGAVAAASRGRGAAGPAGSGR